MWGNEGKNRILCKICYPKLPTGTRSWCMNLPLTNVVENSPGGSPFYGMFSYLSISVRFSKICSIVWRPSFIIRLGLSFWYRHSPRRTLLLPPWQDMLTSWLSKAEHQNRDWFLPIYMSKEGRRRLGGNALKSRSHSIGSIFRRSQENLNFSVSSWNSSGKLILYGPSFLSGLCLSLLCVVTSVLFCRAVMFSIAVVNWLGKETFYFTVPQTMSKLSQLLLSHPPPPKQNQTLLTSLLTLTTWGCRALGVHLIKK